MKKILGIALLLCSDILLADDKSVLLDTLVVTGTKTEKTVADSPVAVNVVTKEDILASNATSVAEAIEALPGLRLKEIHGQGGDELVMQGMTGNHILVLKDGAPIHNFGISGSNLSRINISDVQRIEIVPGNASVLYGSSAMGGVVNIITNTPKEEWLSLTTTIKQNQDDKYTPSESVFQVDNGLKLDNWTLASQWQFRNRQPYDTPPTDNSEDIAQLIAADVNEKLTYRHTKKTYSDLWFSLVREDTDREYDEQSPGSVLRETQQRNYRSQELGYRYKGNNWDVSVKGNSASLTSETDNLKTVNYLDESRLTDSDSLLLQANKTFITENHDITSGISISQIGIEQTLTETQLSATTAKTEVDNTIKGTEFFIQDDWYVTDELELVSGIRTQWDSGFGQQTVPNIAVRWGVSPDLFIRSSAGLGYRVPNIKERYYHFDHSSSGYEVIGNPDLEPEVAKSLNVELSYKDLTVQTFYKDITNLIDTSLDESIENGLDTYLYSNINSALIYGASIGISHKINKVQLSANYQWTKTKDQDTGLQLDHRPTHIASLKVKRPIRLPHIKSSNVSLSAQYTGEQFYDAEKNEKSQGYLLLNANLSMHFNDQWSASFSGKNLSDVKNEPDIDYDLRPMIGRQWMLTLSYTPY
ncbi:TonB-dependent receptor plug domain-containing protein [Marinomonas balearica]|uniref:Outer membrane receptor for ferrienterochelin and colicins n=1 Tax=Marinomonas balearica TaxID=491947 RepID=A0A4R6M986_9GAMM|nr:TonB-dependent receptor [Marinomonas balearica]TDO98068.1 outer membrane receptor for ferrienterochelin and colicins [Marinomonas balearica]